MNLIRRRFPLHFAGLVIALTACAKYEESPEDKTTKEKFVGYWYWSYIWHGITFHILTVRKADGTWIRYKRLHSTQPEAIENYEDSGKWGINFGRYVEKVLVEDGQSVGVGEREKRYIVKAVSENSIQLEGERIKGEPQIEIRVPSTFQLP